MKINVTITPFESFFLGLGTSLLLAGIAFDSVLFAMLGSAFAIGSVQIVDFKSKK